MRTDDTAQPPRRPRSAEHRWTVSAPPRAPTDGDTPRHPCTAYAKARRERGRRRTARAELAASPTHVQSTPYPFLFSRDRALNHHHEEHLPFVPAADPTHAPAINPISQTDWLSQAQKSGFHQASGAALCRLRVCRRNRTRLARNVDCISLRAYLNCDTRLAFCLRLRCRGSRKLNNVLCHAMHITSRSLAGLRWRCGNRPGERR
jgi:hypothetical protein